MLERGSLWTLPVSLNVFNTDEKAHMRLADIRGHRQENLTLVLTKSGANHSLTFTTLVNRRSGLSGIYECDDHEWMDSAR